MKEFWVFVFWGLMLSLLIGGMGWWWTTRETKIGNGVLWLLLFILGAYAIGLPGLPGK